MIVGIAEKRFFKRGYFGLIFNQCQNDHRKWSKRMSVSLSKTTKKIHRQVQAEDLVLAGNIRTLREQQNLTQQDMSKSLGVSFQQFQKYENGKNRISASRIIEISRLLNTTPNFLLGWSSEMTVSEKTNQNVLSLWRSIHSKSLQRILMLLVKEINQFKQ